MQTSPEPNEEQRRTMAGEYPSHIPAWNGPMRLTTPPPSPAAIVSGLLVEYLIPYPIHLVDTELWPSIQIQFNESKFELQKPKPSSPAMVKASAALGNEGPDAYCTILHVTSPHPLVPRTNGSEGDLFNVILPCLRWLRIIGRQYWFLDSSRGMSASCRGSTFYGGPTAITQANFSSYERAVIVRPLTREMWGWIKQQSESGSAPPVQESLFCDALTSFSAGDVVKALIELGVAIEIELTDLMDEAVPRTKDQGIIYDYDQRKLNHKDGFKWKLLDLAKTCGMSDPANFTAPGGPPNWTETALRLYEFRGAAAHRGNTILIGRHFSSPMNLQASEIQQFIFSAEMVFHWSQTERQRLKLSSFPHRSAPFNRKPILSIIGDTQDASIVRGIFGRTGEVSRLR